MCTRVLCVTIRLQRRATTAQPHDDGSKRKASLHAVLPDAFQNVERKVDVQVTQKHNTVAVLEGNTTKSLFTIVAFESFLHFCFLR